MRRNGLIISCVLCKRMFKQKYLIGYSTLSIGAIYCESQHVKRQESYCSQRLHFGEVDGVDVDLNTWKASTLYVSLSDEAVAWFWTEKTLNEQNHSVLANPNRSVLSEM